MIFVHVRYKTTTNSNTCIMCTHIKLDHSVVGNLSSSSSSTIIMLWLLGSGSMGKHLTRRLIHHRTSSSHVRSPDRFGSGFGPDGYCMLILVSEDMNKCRVQICKKGTILWGWHDLNTHFSCLSLLRPFGQLPLLSLLEKHPFLLFE